MPPRMVIETAPATNGSLTTLLVGLRASGGQASAEASIGFDVGLSKTEPDPRAAPWARRADSRGPRRSTSSRPRARSQRDRGDAKTCRSVQLTRQRRGEVAIRERRRGDEIERSARARVEEPHDGAHLVAQRDRTDPLVPGAHHATEAEPEERQLLLQRATARRQHDAGAQVRHGPAALGERRRRAFPLRADASEEVVADGRGLIAATSSPRDP